MNKRPNLQAVHLELDQLYARSCRCHDSLGYPINLDLAFLEPLSRFLLFGFNNLGNPFEDNTFPLCSWAYEREVLDFVAKLYHFPVDQDYHGYITGGGSEANLQGLLVAREYYPNGILYFSQDSHYSVPKAAHLLRMSHHIVPSLNNGEIDYNALAEAILQYSNQPVILSLNIGTTMKGAIDSIDRIMEILAQTKTEHYYIHCDAALFGMMLPFLELDQVKYPDFRYPIQSLAISGHKFMGCPFPSGIILTRSIPEAKHIAYVDTLDTTISGSRNGHSPLILWYILQVKGEAGLKQEVQTCLSNAHYLYQQLKQHNYPCQLNPHSNIVLLKPPPRALSKKWDLAIEGDWAHIVVMQHVTRAQLDLFLADLLAL
ncbi:histidine decarboxylase [Thioflexithrix psekupsensis]|uniref:Histidine decarboxylase n=1 Tax=Thioflexithrix psekupsensis TaxID=1570016 RepID=A0A251X6W5_9GAMM|nr:histidine decarboxylase [Thioflexithrix psekupsensis]OUD13818.1 hypothetical protein TPSD3_05570 [Thioflexithrix psekupsensis]